MGAEKAAREKAAQEAAAAKAEAARRAEAAAAKAAAEAKLAAKAIKQQAAAKEKAALAAAQKAEAEIRDALKAQALLEAAEMNNLSDSINSINAQVLNFANGNGPLPDNAGFGSQVASINSGNRPSASAAATKGRPTGAASAGLKTFVASENVDGSGDTRSYSGCRQCDGLTATDCSAQAVTTGNLQKDATKISTTLKKTFDAYIYVMGVA